MLDIRLDRKKFLNNIKIVENAINEDKADGITSGIFVEAKDDMLILKGIGDSLFIKTKMECEIITPGEFIIKHKLMEEFLRQIEQDIIQIKETSGKISIISGKNSSEFAIYQYQHRPEPEILNGFEYEFDKEKFLDDIEKVRFAASTSLEKLIVNCLRLEINDNKFNLVSSDAHRLIYLNKDLDFEMQEELGLSIPLKTINSLIKILRLSVDDKQIKLKTEGNKLLFKLNDVDIITKLVEIKYPDYKTLLKNIQSSKFAIINSQSFISILRRISVFVKDNTDKKDIAIFNFLENSLEIEGKNDFATTKEKIDIIYEGAPLKIALNVRYIIEYLSTNDAEKLIEIKLNSERTPVLLNFKDDTSSIYLIAPTQV